MAGPLHLTSTTGLLTAFDIALAAAVIAVSRRPAVPLLASVLIAAGLAAAALAAGGPVWRRPAASEFVVMVDLSPSTRTAAYYDREWRRRRVHQLLGDTPHRIAYFADGVAEIASDAGRSREHDLPAERTTFAPPAGAAA